MTPEQLARLLVMELRSHGREPFGDAFVMAGEDAWGDKGFSDGELDCVIVDSPFDFLALAKDLLAKYKIVEKSE